MVARDFDTVVASARFEAARTNHTELRAFLRRMPKGGDLHTHLSGAVYAERFIAWAASKISAPILRTCCCRSRNASSGRCVRGRRHARPEALRSTGQRILDALIRADRRGADRSRQILRGVRQIRRRLRLALRRHDPRSAQGLSQRKRAICRVHGVVFVLERSRQVHQGDGRPDRRCRQARGAEGERPRRMRRGEAQRSAGLDRKDQTASLHATSSGRGRAAGSRSASSRSSCATPRPTRSFSRPPSRRR